MTKSYANTDRGFNISYVGLADLNGIAKDGDYIASSLFGHRGSGENDIEALYIKDEAEVCL